jgi:hypothetical protein
VRFSPCMSPVELTDQPAHLLQGFYAAAPKPFWD